MRLIVINLFLAVMAAGACRGADVHSNGTGGGLWSDPGTWHGGKVPAAADTVVVAMRDTVIFDRNDVAGPSCANVYIDPEGVLAFKTGAGKFTLTVNGSVESYGVIKIDGTKSPRAVFELRLTGSSKQERGIRLLQNSALLAYGHKGLAGGAKNVLITALGTDGKKEDRRAATIVAQREAMIDLHHVSLTDLIVRASLLDNTGSRANERLNFIGNRFVGLSRLEISHCDTPAVRDNLFESGDLKVDKPAVAVDSCKLAEIRGNHIRGGYTRGIDVRRDVDSSALENTVVGPAEGIYWHGSNAMIKGNKITASSIGVRIEKTTGAIENVSVEKAKTGFDLTDCTLQFTNCQVEEQPEDGVAMKLNTSSVTLLNCNIADDQIKLDGKAPNGPWVQSMQYLVVKVKGKYPPGTHVKVRTAKVSGGVPPGKADLNVRNSPARVAANGLTPLPGSMRSLIVRSWQIAQNKEKTNAPFYDLIVLAPPPVPGQGPKVLKTQLVEPEEGWFRPEPDKPTSDLEVSVP